ncbi:hypothetical protein [Streptomyces sp. NPDC017993]|uniref:hypothetical protein n=1 Tax=Streptomyces sp. NPDC017993 TaxID=3365027 RepID=UPI0037AF8653
MEVRAESASSADSAGPANDAEGSGAVQAAEEPSEGVTAPEEPTAAPASGETATADEPGTDGPPEATANAEIPRQQTAADSEADKGARK